MRSAYRWRRSVSGSEGNVFAGVFRRVCRTSVVVTPRLPRVNRNGGRRGSFAVHGILARKNRVFDEKRDVRGADHENDARRDEICDSRSARG